MNLALLTITLLAALSNWVGLIRGSKLWDYITKPAVIVLLISFVISNANGNLSPRLLWLVIALIFSLIGDIYLMVSKEHLRIGGIAFFITHLSYAVVFGTLLLLPSVGLAGWILGGIVVVFTVGIARQFSKALKIAGKQKWIFPISFYFGGLGLMVLSALLLLVTRPDNIFGIFLASVGALMFYYSDIVLLGNIFIRNIRHSRLKVRISYHIAQISIVVSFFIGNGNLLG